LERARKLQIYGLRGDELNQEKAMRKLSVAVTAAAAVLLVGSLAWKADAQTSREPRISQYNHKFSRLFNERPAEDRDPYVIIKSLPPEY
jgi:hypothetical protein